MNKKSTFAIFFGNRGFFPASHQSSARAEMAQVMKKLGYKYLMLNANATRYGAVETVREGEIYADFLKKNKGKYDGIILCLPNFGDETGAVAALQDAGVPILIQAYPDELDKMSPALRRDSFCGKFSIMDVFFQYGVKFTVLKPHTVSPSSELFAENLDYFDRLCRVVSRMRRMTVGAIGARTTAFKTVRIDEVALQRHGITMETIDLADVFARVRAVKMNDTRVKAKTKVMTNYCSWKGVPKTAFENIIRLGVVLDEIIDEFKLDAIAVRCWLEMQKELGISCCALMGEMNDRGIPASCEVDVGSAVTMYALQSASGGVSACLDWNNNYGDDDDKCILFHCGPVPRAMMTGKGCVTGHAILDTVLGKGKSYGCNTGRIASGPFTFGNLITDKGRLNFYLGQGRFTDDEVPQDFFGCAGVAEIENMQDALLKIGLMGHRHHVAVTPGNVVEPLREAFEKYLGYNLTIV